MHGLPLFITSLSVNNTHNSGVVLHSIDTAPLESHKWDFHLKHKMDTNDTINFSIWQQMCYQWLVCVRGLYVLLIRSRQQQLTTRQDFARKPENAPQHWFKFATKFFFFFAASKQINEKGIYLKTTPLYHLISFLFVSHLATYVGFSQGTLFWFRQSTPFPLYAVTRRSYNCTKWRWIKSLAEHAF